MSNIDPLLARNESFAAIDSRADLPIRPRLNLMIVTCLDPRVDPAAVLGLELGDALVVRNAGGRVNDAVIADVAFISFLGKRMVPDGPLFEVAVVHHTQCGTAILGAEQLRDEYADRTGYDPAELAAVAVTDPAATVRADVAKLLAAPQVADKISVSGHVYDLDTGLVSTVLAPASPQPARVPSA